MHNFTKSKNFRKNNPKFRKFRKIETNIYIFLEKLRNVELRKAQFTKLTKFRKYKLLKILEIQFLQKNTYYKLEFLFQKD